MKHNRLLIALTVALGALGVIGLRYWQLTACLDENGLLAYGSRSGLVLAAWCVLAGAALAVLTVKSNKVKGGPDCITGSTLLGLVQLLGGLLIGSGPLVLLQSYTVAWGIPVCIAGVLGGLLLAVAGLLTVAGKTPPMPLYLIAAVTLTAFTLLNFQRWNLIPSLASFGLELAALGFATLAVFNFGGFGVRQGLTRSTVFFSGLAVIFSASLFAELLARATVAGLPASAILPVPHLLFMGGLLLWNLGALLLMLRTAVQDREPPAAPAETAEPAQEAPAEPENDLEA